MFIGIEAVTLINDFFISSFLPKLHNGKKETLSKDDIEESVDKSVMLYMARNKIGNTSTDTATEIARIEELKRQIDLSYSKINNKLKI